MIFFLKFAILHPFIVQIFQAYDSPIAPDQAAAVLSFIDNLGQLVFVCLVHYTGKRPMFLAVTSGVFLSSLVISCYGFIILPNGFNSFDQQNRSFHVDNPNLAYIPLICLFIWEFFSYCSFIGLPWYLLSELFPLK